MPATKYSPESGAHATPVSLRSDLFDRLASAQGAITEIARARLIGCDRATLWRMRTRHIAPSVSLAIHMAQVLGVRVEDLFEPVEERVS